MDNRRIDDVREDLGFLRKNDGFTESRFRRTPLVLELLHSDPDESFERSKSRFLSAIHSLESAEAELLLDVFALSADTHGSRSLGDRRAIHGQSIGRGIDTVASREGVALDHLTTRLITGTYAQSPVALHVPELHGGIVFEQVSILVVVKDRRWLETIERYRFVATFDEMDLVRIPRTYPAIVSTPPRGRFRVSTLPSAHGEIDHFWHLRSAGGADEPMLRGNSYDLGIKLEPPSTDRNPPLRLTSRAFHERTLLATIRVQFVGDRPRLLWAHERLSSVESPGRPTERSIRELEADGAVTLRLRDVYGGLYSGFAWSF